MTKSVKKTICFIAILLVLSAVFTFFAVATEGFTESNGAKWFNYWGKGAPAKQVQTTSEPAEQSGFAMQSASGGLTYDSEETTYSVTKHRAPRIYLSGSNVVIDTFQAYGAWGTTAVVEIVADNKVIESYNLTYTETYPSYSNGNYSEKLMIPVESIRALSSAEYLTIRAYNKATSVNYLDSDTTSVLAYNSFETYMYNASTTVLSIPRITIGDTTLSYKIYATNGSAYKAGSYSSYPYTRLDTNDSNVGGSSQSSVVCDKNSAAITIFPDRYDVILSQLSFIDEINTINTVSIVVDSFSATTSAGTVTLGLFDFSDFVFSISQLSAPQNIQFADNKLTWDEVDDAEGYAVFEGDNNWTVNIPEFDLTDKEFEGGEHTFRIRALGNVGRALAASDTSAMVLTAYNASSRITRLVCLTYSVDGDTITKFVPYNATISDYLYDVQISDKVFGGWFYDSGYSVKVNGSDKLEKDITVYARLSDVKVTDRPLTWWEQYRWYVLIPCIAAVVVMMIIFGIVYSVKKKKRG